MSGARGVAVLGPDLVVSGLQAVLDRRGAGVAVTTVGLDRADRPSDAGLVLYAWPYLTDEDQRLQRLCRAHHDRPVGLLADDLSPGRVARAREAGVASFISSLLPGPRLADAVLRALSGEPPMAAEADPHPDVPAGGWPGERDGLSRRESQVLVLVAEGLTNREIATALFLSPETVKGYLRDVFAKLGLRNRVAAAAYLHASRAGEGRAGGRGGATAGRALPVEGSDRVLDLR